MQPDYCYIYVQGWKADDDFEERAQAAASPGPSPPMTAARTTRHFANSADWLSTATPMPSIISA